MSLAGGAGERQVFVSPQGRVLGTLDPDARIAALAAEIHGSLLLGRWGDWLDEVTLRQEYRGLTWLLLLLLLVLGCVHLFVMGRVRANRKRGGS